MGTDFFDDDLGQRRGSIKSTTLGSGNDGTLGMKADEAPVRPISDLNLTRMARHREEVNTQMVSAKLHIERLKQKQGEMEREKHMLEDLLEKQDQYERGKQEMMDRLTESVVSLQKLGEHAARQVEIYGATRDRFSVALDELQQINDAIWPEDLFRDELNKAVAQIDAIRSDFVKAQATVEAVGGPVKLFDENRPKTVKEEDFSPVEFKGFAYWFKIGLAASLPLIAAIVVAIVVIILKSH
ncbi:MAG: hypothetical protein WCI20_01840 [bacterium]